MNRRRMMMLQQSKGLPSGYTKLDYIVSPQGSLYDGAWLNIGLYPTNITNVHFKINPAISMEYGPFLVSAGSNFRFPYHRTLGNRSHFVWQTTGTALQTLTTPKPYKTNVDYEYLITDTRDFFLNGEFITNIGMGANPTDNQLVFGTYNGTAGGNAGHKFCGKLYFLKIYEGKEIVRDFIPCINPEGVVGMYDLVESKFYKSEGTLEYEV